MNSQLSDIDRKMLRLLLDSKGTIMTHEISQQLDIPVKSVQRRRKRLEEEYLIRHYSLDPMKFGYRRIDLLIFTEGGETDSIGKELLKRDEVVYAGRTIGEHTLDLRVEAFVQDDGALLDLIEAVKALKGVGNVVWIEVIEVIGSKNPPIIL